MSLINKMLQDLDARGGVADADAIPASRAVKAVPLAERERRPLVVAVAGMMLVLLAVGGWYGWQYWQYSRNHDFTVAPVPQVVVDRTPPNPAVTSVATAAPIPPVAPAASVAETTQPQSRAGLALERQTPAMTEQAQPAPLPAKPTKPPSPLEKNLGGAAPSSSSASQAMASGSGVSTASIAAPVVQAASSRPSSPSEAPVASRPRRAPTEAEARAAEGRPAAADGVMRRELTPKVESDSAYRRALVALGEGRVSVAMADLERAVEIDPRNESARQTYVSLLLENKRPDDAIRQLRLSLGVDPRQPALAMVLARLQLERGGPALATLMKTLPHAANNADYLAFLAGVLQREQRHADAARYYRDALQIAPNNGVWWMGLGISLQAEQHVAEAREAYTRARASAGMTAELLAFVDRKLEQLAR